MTDEQLRLTAHHEAGHYAAAVVLGFRVMGISLNADGGRAGIVGIDPASMVPLSDVSPALPPRRKQRVADQIVFTLAGPIAEAALLGRWDLESGRTDFEHARSFFAALKEDDAALVALIERAKHLVVGHWRGIEAVARHMLEVTEVGPDKVRGLALRFRRALRAT